MHCAGRAVQGRGEMSAEPRTGMRPQEHSTPLVSVIIPAFNTARYIAEAIESVLAQTYSRHEIIVSDDGSTDKTREVLEPFKEKVRYLYQENRGVSAARNLGVRFAKGDLIAFLDADDVWLPRRLEKQMGFLEKHPDVSMVFADCELFSRSGTVAGSFLGEKKCFGNFIGGERVIPDAFERLLDENYIPTSTVILKRGSFQGVGGFDESLRSVEDRDLWLRIAVKHPVGCVPDVLSRKRLHSENISSDQVEALRSQIRVYTKILGDPLMSKRADHPFIKSRLAELHFMLGYGYFKKGIYPEARENFILSHSGGMWIKPAAYFALTLMGKRWVERLLKVKHVWNSR